MSPVGLALTVALLLGVVTMTSASPSSRNYENYERGLRGDFAQIQHPDCEELYRACIGAGAPSRVPKGSFAT